jgi:hypothetical protein
MNPKIIFHWTARIAATAVSLVVLGVVLSRSTNSSEWPPLRNQSTAEMLTLSIILISTLALLAGWHHEVFGGLLATIGGAVLVVMAAMSSDDVRPIWVLGAGFLVPGLLYLASAVWPYDHDGNQHSGIHHDPQSQH